MAYVIGMDIGGTQVKGVVCDEQGRTVAEAKHPTHAASGRDAILASLRLTASELIARCPDAKAIGIGTAGRVDVRTGVVVYATDNLPGWMGTDLAKWGRDNFGLPTFADNDGNAALLGEAWTGAARGLTDAAMLTLGTGVGGAILSGGRIVRGANHSGGEWGHVVLVPGGRACNCGRHGCLEQYASGTALVRDASAAAGRTFADGREAVKALQAGEPAVVDVFRRYAEHLAVAIGNIVQSLDPQAILIGGGVVESGEHWWPYLTEALQASPFKAEVRPAALGNRAGSLGAAKLAWDSLAGV
ncbi:ROK family protein [Paenibacillus thermoaerophilus]|uniref:ROK family protein n=1 Tax=Paenibacillus thermoaerophilus TaxID=1215385 RepID=A0ABW2VAA8_9BACL|nr:ROK family protein [Paenibacillus thermoaerophilus]TMV17956.1 ROK family protein [Paenibacillus thermoaerophilus]